MTGDEFGITPELMQSVLGMAGTPEEMEEAKRQQALAAQLRTRSMVPTARTGVGALAAGLQGGLGGYQGQQAGAAMKSAQSAQQAGSKAYMEALLNALRQRQAMTGAAVPGEMTMTGDDIQGY